VFERFTTESREVVRRAVEEAQRLDSPAVGPEHLLLALATAATSRPAAALAANGVDRAARLARRASRLDRSVTWVR